MPCSCSSSRCSGARTAAHFALGDPGFDDCTGPAGDEVEADSGTVVVTAGTGGTGLRKIDTSRPEADYFAAASEAGANATHGFVRLDIGEDRVAARFESVAGGDFTDAFTILR